MIKVFFICGMILLSLFIVFVLVFSLWWLISTFAVGEDRPFIPFSIVKTGYSVNPSRWSWDNTQPSLGIKNNSGWGDWYRLHFIDWIRAYFFFSLIEKEKQQKTNREELIKILQIVQQDVDKALKESQQEQEDALQQMDKTLKTVKVRQFENGEWVDRGEVKLRL